MESTGVYWIAPHEVLEAEGLEVMLVDTRQLARVPGRDKKSDPFDCEWIQRLHSCGLLMGSFRPGIAEPVRCAEVAHNARDVNIFTCSFA
jgi:transposase